MPIALSKNRQISPIFIITVCCLLLFNFLVSQNAILGLILGILWLIYTSKILGKFIFPQKPAFYQNLFGFLILQIIIILFSCLFFYIINFSNISISVVLVLISALVIILNYSNKNKQKILKPLFNLFLQFKTYKFNLKNIIKQIFLFAGYIILYLISFSYLFKYQSADPLLSPWQVLPKNFFIIYFLLTILLLIIIFNNKKNNLPPHQNLWCGGLPITRYLLPITNIPILKLTLLSLHSFLTLSIAAVVYKIGFGFDPFVHRASENALASLGYILPKPLYYIGQYTLIVFWSKILFIKIALLDKLLVPFLASLFLPSIAYFSFEKLFKNKKLTFLILVYCLLFIVCCFFCTVPQSLANLFLLILIILSIPHLADKTKLPYWLWLFAPAIMLIHPLSGIPAFIYLGFITLRRFYKSKSLQFIYLFLASISIPLFFFLASLISNSFNIQFKIPNLSNIFSIFPVPNYLPFYSVYHLIYLYKFNILILFALIFITGSYYLYKKNNNNLLTTYCLLLTALTINLLLLLTIEFTSVINYEQAEFANRLLQIILLFSLPIIFCGIYFISKKILGFNKGKLILIMLTAAIGSLTLYISYPHVDAFEKNRGYSVSKYDILAVDWINQDAGNQDYIVLANQSTSAAALQQFGFKKYYRSKTQNLFYYPIPTSSPLYEIYLKMIYDEPRLEYINQARELTGVSPVYFVISGYWLDSKKRVEQAQEIADQTKNIENKIWIFKFE